MSTLTVEDVRALFPNFLDDNALTGLIDAATEDVEAYMGGTMSNEIVPVERPTNYIRTIYPIENLVEVKTDKSFTDNMKVSLRLVDGSNNKQVEVVSPSRIYRIDGYFYKGTTVSYVPKIKSMRKRQAIIDLVKLYASYSPDRVNRTGDVSSSQKDFHMERNAILDRVRAKTYYSLFA